MPHHLSLYVDGGVIHQNPSPYGGTWAWVLVDPDENKMVKCESGAFMPGILRDTLGHPYQLVTNNVTEMFAMLKGLHNIEPGKRVYVYSDSKITLGRIWDGWKCKGLPPLLDQWMIEESTRLDLENIPHFHLDGHPTPAQLISGIGRHGNPVSQWNKLCDDLCREAGELLPRNGPSEVTRTSGIPDLKAPRYD